MKHNDPKERYKPKTYKEAVKEICKIMTPELIQRVKMSIDVASDVGRGYDEDKENLGKVLSLCSLVKEGLEGY